MKEWNDIEMGKKVDLDFRDVKKFWDLSVIFSDNKKVCQSEQ